MCPNSKQQTMSAHISRQSKTVLWLDLAGKLMPVESVAITAACHGQRNCELREREIEMEMQTRGVFLGHVKQVKQTNVQRQHITQLGRKLTETAN